jgi:tetratricopeptide (TPR) repeat protein
MNRYMPWCGPIIVLMLLTACAGPKVVKRCTDAQDNAPHHVLQAMEQLEAGRLEEARTKLERAIFCDETYPPAYAGRALLLAMQAVRQTDAGYRQVDTGRALAELDQAARRSKTPEDRFIYLTTAIRVLTHLKGEKWLEQAQRHFRQSQELTVDEKKLLYYQGREAAIYFMGVAYYTGVQDFGRARDLFRQVLDAKRESRWHEKADEAWKKADKIARATAGITVGDVGRQIATRDQVSRGDLAAFLVDELKVDQLFAGRIPVRAIADQQRAPFIPADVLSHPFKTDMLTLMKWQIRGLEPQYDAQTRAPLFRPDAAVARKEVAIVLEDVLIKLTGDERLASAFIGQDKSPFPDVVPTAPWYNAVVNAVTRGLMKTELSGEFRPDAPADGAEVLLAVRVLKQRLNIR